MMIPMPLLFVAFCANISTLLQPYALVQFSADCRLLEIMVSGATGWSEVLQPVAAEPMDTCGLQCPQVYIHYTGRFSVICWGK